MRSMVVSNIECRVASIFHLSIEFIISYSYQLGNDKIGTGRENAEFRLYACAWYFDIKFYK